MFGNLKTSPDTFVFTFHFPRCTHTSRSCCACQSPCTSVTHPQHLASRSLDQKPFSNTMTWCICFNLPGSPGRWVLLNQFRHCQIKCTKIPLAGVSCHRLFPQKTLMSCHSRKLIGENHAVNGLNASLSGSWHLAVLDVSVPHCLLSFSATSVLHLHLP